MSPPITRRAVPITLLAVAFPVVLAACGGSSPGRSSSHPSAHSAFLAVGECMRSHGVTDFPDPNGNGITLPPGVNPAAPSFRSAQAICSHLMPGGAPNGHKDSKQLVATSECMRAHGVTGFPDPYSYSGSGPPNLNRRTDYSSVRAGGGEVLAVPKSIDENSPAFRQAAKACHFS